MHLFDLADHPPDDQLISIVRALVRLGCRSDSDGSQCRSAIDRARAMPELAELLGGESE